MGYVLVIGIKINDFFFLILFALKHNVEVYFLFVLLPWQSAIFNLPRRKKHIKMEKHYLRKIPLSKVSLHL